MGRTQTLASGTTLGPYQIIRLIGVGGMGEVYEAYESRLDRHVALKIISPEIEQDKADDIAQRFINEALNLAKINHPNVVIIYNADRAGDMHFIAMEYVDGVSLKELLKKKRLGIDEVILVFLQLLEGLRCLHDHKMIHRDMKPHNIVFRANGQLKILDFGIAKRMDDISDRTQAGVIVGSVPYMAPEIRNGQLASVKTDLWSVGAVMYEALVGEPLIKEMPSFGKDAVKDKIGIVAFSKQASETIPEELQFLVKRLCAPNPVKRYSTAAEVIAELKGIQASRPGGEAQGMALLAEKLASLAPRPALPQVSSVSREIRPKRKKERLEPVEQPQLQRSPSYAFVFFAAVAAIATGLWLGQRNHSPKKALSVASKPNVVAPTSPSTPSPNESLWLQYVSPRDRQSLWLEDKQIVTLSWVPSLPRGDFRLIVAKDKDFLQVVISDLVEGLSFRPDRLLAEGTYFWKLVPQRTGLKVPSVQSFSLSYVSPPEMTTPSEKQELSLSAQQTTMPIDLGWNCKFGAIQYRLQIAGDLAFAKNLKERVTTDCKHREVLPAGTYYWRARVEEPSASLRIWSEPREFLIKKNIVLSPRLATTKPEKKLKRPVLDKKKVAVKKIKPTLTAPAPEEPLQESEEPVRIPSAAPIGVPTTELPRNGMSVRLGNSKAISVTFSWSEVADSVGYEIEISSDSDFKKTIMRKAVSENRWTYRNAEFKGKIFWRVRAQSPAAAGDWSQVSTFEIN